MEVLSLMSCGRENRTLILRLWALNVTFTLSHDVFRAGKQNRTVILCLEGRRTNHCAILAYKEPLVRIELTSLVYKTRIITFILKRHSRAAKRNRTSIFSMASWCTNRYTIPANSSFDKHLCQNLEKTHTRTLRFLDQGLYDLYTVYPLNATLA